MDKDSLRCIFSDASRVGWSLRSDVQLQEWLEGFAERLKERTNEVTAEVDRLRTETGNIELHLQNSFNSLRALSATQFIENRVDEVDEVSVDKVEQPIKQSRFEGYDSEIIPRYKEAVLVAWDAFQGFRTSKTSLQSSDVKWRGTSQALQTRSSMKLPHIIGTEEFTRDIHCGLAGEFKFPELNARASSSETIESGSDTDRDEARMAAEMVGGRSWLEGEWSATESETSGHQGGALEPAVSAALDFKAMLEAALRGPSFPYDGGIIPNLEDKHGQHNFVDNTITLFAHDMDSNTPSVKSVGGTSSEPVEIKLEGDLSIKYGQTPMEDNVQHQSQGLASEALDEVNKTVLLQTPIQMPPAFSINDYAHVTGSMGPQSPSTSTPTYTPALNSPRDGFRDDLERSLGISLRSDSLPQGITSKVAKVQNTIGSSLLRTEENKPQPASQFRPSNAVTEDLPMPTLPDGLFQGLQVAIQARQLKSQSMQRNEDSPDKEVMQRSDTVGEIRSPISAEKSITSRLSPAKLNLKDNRGLISKSKVDTTSRLQKDSKGVSSSVITPGPISFQGGLFDDDDDDDMDESADFLSKEVTEAPKDGAAKFGEKQSSLFMGSLVTSSSMFRQGLFDDLGDLSIGSPSGSAAAANSRLVERANATQQSSLSLPDWKDAKRSSVLKKSLFGDSDNEDSE